MILTKSLKTLNVLTAGIVLASLACLSGLSYGVFKLATIDIPEKMQKQNFFVKDSCKALCETPCLEEIVDGRTMWVCYYQDEIDAPLSPLNHLKLFFVFEVILSACFLAVLGVFLAFLHKRRLAQKADRIVVRVERNSCDDQLNN